MYYRIEDRMAKELKLSWNELLIYGVIYSSQNQTYIRWQNNLAEITWMWIATEKRCLKNMIDNGLIRKVSKWYQIVSNWYPKVSEWYFTGEEEKYQNDTWKYQNDTIKVSKWATSNKLTITKNIKKIKKESLSVDDILEWFREYTWIENEQAIEAIRTRLEYKQSSKHKYNTVQWAITQIQKVLWLLGQNDRINKLKFCVNNSIANNRQGLGWYESTEKEFYARLSQEQKTKQKKEIPKAETKGKTYWDDTINSIIDQVIEQQVEQGIIQSFN